MKTQEHLRLVRIIWEGPFTLPKILEKNGEEDYGLYMIEGHNLLYGCKGGLYFGMARDQTYATRLSQHEWWIEHEQNITIRLGRPALEDYNIEPPGWPDWARLVADVEALTIYWHGFPYNSKHIQNYSGQPLHVQNLGQRGNLQVEYSSNHKLPRPSPDEEE